MSAARLTHHPPSSILKRVRVFSERDVHTQKLAERVTTHEKQRKGTVGTVLKTNILFHKAQRKALKQKYFKNEII